MFRCRLAAPLAAQICGRARYKCKARALARISFLFFFQLFSNSFLCVQRWILLQGKCPEEPEFFQNVGGAKICRDSFGQAMMMTGKGLTHEVIIKSYSF